LSQNKHIVRTISRRERFTIVNSGKGNFNRLSRTDNRYKFSNSMVAGNISSGANNIGNKQSETLLTYTFVSDMERMFGEISGDGSLLKFKSMAHLSKDQKYPLNPNDIPFVQQLRKTDSTKTKTKRENMASSIIHSDDSISTRLFANWITSKYMFSLDKFIAIQEPTISKIMEDDKFEKTFKLEGGYTNYLAYNNEALIIVSQRKVEGDQERSEVYFEIFAKDIEVYYEYYEYVMALDETSKKDTLIIEFHSLYVDQFRGISSNVEYFKQDIFEDVISDFYAPYLDTNLLFEQYLTSRSVILQLTGQPGIGKSKLIALFVKYLTANTEYLVKDNIVKIARPATSEVLAEEEFWVKLRQDGFQALILDDVDHILQKRNESITSSEEKMHNEIIRKILTFTDGLTSQKSKILVSTNLEYHKIDKALIRDFRLFDSIELRALTFDEAKEIWVNTYELQSLQFDTVFTGVNKITSAKLSKEIESVLNHTQAGDDGSSRSYLKEKGISKVHSLRSRSNRIGLV